jgi:hypothetical protein
MKKASSVVSVLVISFSSSRLVKGKAIPVQDWTSPEVSRMLRLPDFKTILT